MKKFILLTIGFISLAIGGIGIIFPVLPTTPFVILSAFCFMYSSEKLYKKLLATKYFGEYIRNYKEKTGVSVKIKVRSIIFLWTALAISAVIARNNIVYIILASVGCAVTVHLLCLKTKKENKKMCNQKFFRCAHCGNLIGLIENKGVPLVCCGEEMQELIPNTVEASTEKHLPVAKVTGDIISVEIGSTPHPMLEEHHISFVYLETENGGQRKCLTSVPKTEFSVVGDKATAVYAYCNLHGLWKTEIK